MTALPPNAVADLERAVADLERQLQSARAENDRLERELGIARDRQGASADILRTIASAPGDAGRSLQQIAEACARLFGAPGASILLIGVCRQQIQKYENGTDRLAASTAIDLAEQFGVTVDELLGLNGLDEVLAKPVRKNLESGNSAAPPLRRP
jgi:transcriptional regulator with XRE-family HTH domain